MTKNVLLERQGPVAIVTINRPEVRNCINAAVAGEMRDVFDALEMDDSLACVVLTGAGEVAFSTGLDLKQLAQEGPSLIPKVIFEETGWAGIGRRPFSKALIAAVNGYAIAGGLELALSCDFAIASDNAILGFNEATLGPIADAGGCFRLPHWVPLPFAREMLLTGRLINAQEAFRVGLVNRIVEQKNLISTCVELGHRIAKNSPSATRIMKSLISETLDRPETDAWLVNDRYMRESFETEDFMEGPRAYVEKRPARFRSKRIG